MKSKTESKVAQDKKTTHYTETQNRLLNQKTTTQHTPITNMRKAYREVTSSGYSPTPEEIHFRRFTSGSMIDSE